MSMVGETFGYGPPMPGLLAWATAGAGSGASRYVGKIPTMADIYSKVESLSGSVMDTLRGYGTAAQQDLEQNYRNALGMGTQALVQSGLAGTSAMPSMRMGYYRQYQRALNDLNQKIMQTKAGYQTQLGGMQAQVGMSAAQAAIGSEQAGRQLSIQRAGLLTSGGGGGGGPSSMGGGSWNQRFMESPNWGMGGGGRGGGYRSEPAGYYPTSWGGGGENVDLETDPYYGQFWGGNPMEGYAPESDYTSVGGGGGGGGGYSQNIASDEGYDYDAFYGYYE